MNITPYIRDLILLNECVILRGVGGFETSYKNAAFDKNQNTIIPPSKHIHFRPEMVRDNGILEDHLCKVTGVSREESARLIDDFVKDFLEKIHSTGKILLEGIGEFSYDKNGKLTFSELEDVNYLADSFGLDSLEIQPLTTHVVKIPDQQPIPVIPQKRKLTGWYVAIGILVLGISVTLIILIAQSAGIRIFSLTDAPDQKKEDIIVFGPQVTSKSDSLSIAIEETINSNTSPRNALAIETQKPVSKPVKVVKKTSSDATYLLIAGSFKNSRNADAMKNNLLQDGFKPEVIYTKGDYYRVVIGKFNDRQEAINELRRIRKQISQSVWLWEKN